MVITIYVYMEPEYSDIVDLEQWFTKIAEEHGGEYDGWGCMKHVYDDEDGTKTKNKFDFPKRNCWSHAF